LTTVVDTNVVAALMLPTVANAEVAELLRQDSDWRLPPLWRSEFRQVLLKYVRADLATPEQALALWHKALERFELSEQPVAGHQVLAGLEFVQGRQKLIAAEQLDRCRQAGAIDWVAAQKGAQLHHRHLIPGPVPGIGGFLVVGAEGHLRPALGSWGWG
jgi:predicted nucleic acid-binding protein